MKFSKAYKYFFIIKQDTVFQKLCIISTKLQAQFWCKISCTENIMLLLKIFKKGTVDMDSIKQVLQMHVPVIEFTIELLKMKIASWV